MTDRARIEEIINNAYDARHAGNVDAIMACFRPDATFELCGSAATFPAASRVQGEAGLRGTFAALIGEFDFLERTLLMSVIEDNKAAMHWRVRLRHVRSGETHETELFDLWTIEGDRVASVVQFCDTALAANLMTKA